MIIYFLKRGYGVYYQNYLDEENLGIQFELKVLGVGFQDQQFNLCLRLGSFVQGVGKF